MVQLCLQLQIIKMPLQFLITYKRLKPFFFSENEIKTIVDSLAVIDQSISNDELNFYELSGFGPPN